MSDKKIVHVIGTGTIGEPLIGLLASYAEKLGIDEVTFNKMTPNSYDVPKVRQLLARGALLCTAKDKMGAFKEQGLEVAFESEEAIRRATVVIDCTPSGVGIANKNEFYQKYADRVRGFIAQGSEFGFGKMYARGINDHTLNDDDQFIQVVSCNTHNISVLINTLASDGEGNIDLEEGRFLCLRRANDISQSGKFVPSPVVGKHSDAQFGTHHARDAYHLFQTVGAELNLFSSACVLNTQYMHALHFALRLKESVTVDHVLARFRDNPAVALTDKMATNLVFSFGREHGYYGRLLNQTVVSVPSVMVRNEREVVGYCFTPQDGNSLLSSVAAALRFLDPKTANERIDCLSSYLFQEI